MTIEENLRSQLTAAIKGRDLKTANIVRMINTKVMERRTAKGFSGQVDDALYMDVIAAYQKSLIKARKEFEAAGERGAESIAELDFEIAFCNQFLPAMMSEDEVRALVSAAVAELGQDPKLKGRIVGAIMKEHKGKVDPAMVQALVGEALGG